MWKGLYEASSVAFLLLVGVLSGCGWYSTSQERQRRYSETTNLNLRESVDDWDYFWLADRPSYLTYWNVRGSGD